jgi:hypothetical protein
MEHYNVSFNDNGTLTEIPRHPLVWVPEMSAGKEDDMFVLPNIALLVSRNRLPSTSYTFKTQLYYRCDGVRLCLWNCGR